MKHWVYYGLLNIPYTYKFSRDVIISFKVFVVNWPFVKFFILEISLTKFWLLCVSLVRNGHEIHKFSKTL